MGANLNRRRLLGTASLAAGAAIALYAENDRVIAFITWEGTHRGDFYDIPATGRYVQYKTADIARIKDGRIAEH